jgi:hypothetical protein
VWLKSGQAVRNKLRCTFCPATSPFPLAGPRSQVPKKLLGVATLAKQAPIPCLTKSRTGYALARLDAWFAVVSTPRTWAWAGSRGRGGGYGKGNTYGYTDVSLQVSHQNWQIKLSFNNVPFFCYSLTIFALKFFRAPCCKFAPKWEEMVQKGGGGGCLFFWGVWTSGPRFC